MALESLLHVVKEEIPDTAAAVRLSGLEIADAVEEVSSFGSDLTQGIRASARAIVDADQNIRSGITFANKAMSNVVVPSVKKGIPASRGKVEDALKERANLQYSEPTLREMAGATKSAVRRLRTVLGAASVANYAAGAVRGAQQRRISSRNSSRSEEIEEEITGA